MISEDQLNLWGRRLYERCRYGTEEEMAYLRFLENLYLRATNGNDSINAVCGPRNSGKSNVSLVSSLILRHMGLIFDFQKTQFYGMEDVPEIVEKVTGYRNHVFNFDEGIKLAYKKRSMSSPVALWEETLTQVRKKNNTYFLNIPKFTTLTSDTRNDLVHFWMEVVEKSQNLDHHRGWLRVMLFARDETPLLEDPWLISHVQKSLRYRKRRASSATDTERLMRRVGSYVRTFRVPRLPKPIEDAYDEKAQEALTQGGKEAASSFRDKEVEAARRRELADWREKVEKEKEAELARLRAARVARAEAEAEMKRQKAQEKAAKGT